MDGGMLSGPGHPPVNASCLMMILEPDNGGCAATAVAGKPCWVLGLASKICFDGACI
jgi:hypothetical protein